jgi:predicted RNase H-like HicB family nuclease
MKPLIRIKVQRTSDGCYRAFSDDIRDLSAEGHDIWEALKAARIAVRKFLGPAEGIPS